MGFRRHHHVGLGRTHDGKAAANGGLDLEMPSALFMNKQILLPFIQSGEIPTAHNRDKVRRILRKAIQFRVLRSRANRRNHPFVQQEGRQLLSKKPAANRSA